MGRKHHGHLLVLVVLSACFARVSAAEVPVRPFGVIQAGDARVTLSRDGCFWLTCPDKATALKAQLIVRGEVGKGVGNQATCRLLDGHPRKDGKSFVFRGEIDDPASEKTWRFEQRVEPAGNAIRFSYEIEPLADGKAAEVSLFIDLPVDRWCGKRLFFWLREEFCRVRETHQ